MYAFWLYLNVFQGNIMHLNGIFVYFNGIYKYLKVFLYIKYLNMFQLLIKNFILITKKIT